MPDDTSVITEADESSAAFSERRREAKLRRQGRHRATGSFAGETIPIIGNCCAGTIGQSFNRLPELVDYNFEVWPIHINDEPPEGVAKHLPKAKRVVLQDISNVERVGALEMIPPGCEIIRFPQIVLPAIWPWAPVFFREDKAARLVKDAPISQRDGLLGRLREQYPDKEERFRAYRDLDESLLRRVDTLFQMQNEKLEAIDETYGMTAGGYIIDHFKVERFFANPLHPRRAIYQMIADYVWEKLSFPGKCPPLGRVVEWKENLPVHPRVAERFGIEWAKPDTLWRYGDLGEVTWEQFVRRYIDVFG